MRIAHLLYFSPPAGNGYAVRSHRILQGQTELGWTVAGWTHPGMRSLSAGDHDCIDGIDYYRLKERGGLWARLKTRWIQDDLGVIQVQSREALSKIEAFAPDVIHAHSPHVLGRSALEIGRRLGCPVVYEVRGLWEDSGVISGLHRKNSPRYRRARAGEWEALQGADHVVAISAGLRRDLVDRGIPEKKISVVPNGADPPESIEGIDFAGVRSRLGLGDAPVVGYIGSLWSLEGLEDLIDAVARLVRSGDVPNLRCLLVGDGPSRKPLEARAAKLGISDVVVFAGRVDHSDIAKYYRALDVLVVPRQSSRVTEIVTPIKPLEGMSYGISLLVSDVGGLTELVTHDKTGWTYPPGDVSALAGEIHRLLADGALRQRLGENARSWILANRTWKQSIETYREVYELIRPAKVVT